MAFSSTDTFPMVRLYFRDHMSGWSYDGWIDPPDIALN